MPRNLTHGIGILAQDIQRLTRTLRRIQEDETIPLKVREEIGLDIQRVIAKLAAASSPLKANGARRKDVARGS